MGKGWLASAKRLKPHQRITSKPSSHQQDESRKTKKKDLVTFTGEAAQQEAVRGQWLLK